MGSRSGSKHGTYRSTKTGRLEKYDSSWELRRFKVLDESPLVKTWTKSHGIRIRYKEGKRRRRYLPDILVERADGSRQLEEIKGYVFDRLNLARKNLAALIYCKNRNIEFRILREADLERVE